MTDENAQAPPAGGAILVVEQLHDLDKRVMLLEERGRIAQEERAADRGRVTQVEEQIRDLATKFDSFTSTNAKAMQHQDGVLDGVKLAVDNIASEQQKALARDGQTAAVLRELESFRAESNEAKEAARTAAEAEAIETRKQAEETARRQWELQLVVIGIISTVFGGLVIVLIGLTLPTSQRSGVFIVAALTLSLAVVIIAWAYHVRRRRPGKP